jgi:hypothetical protein
MSCDLWSRRGAIERRAEGQMHATSDAAQWATSMFGDCELGDRRRTKRLVSIATDLASSFGASLAEAVGHGDAAVEGAYRFMRNKHIDARAIAEAGFHATALRAAQCEELLAVEDTTSLSYTHTVSDQLGELGGPKKAPGRGMFVHSVLLVDAQTGGTVGLVHQHLWQRDTAQRGLRYARRKRAYEDKESAKWQHASAAVEHVVGSERMRDVISVCDREADVYPYLLYKLTHGGRFIVRASWNRRAADEEGLGYLWPLMGAARVIGRVKVAVKQRDDRPARTATVTVRARRLAIRKPQNLRGSWPAQLHVGVVWAREENAPPDTEPLEWMLLTTQSVGTRDGALRVLRFYAWRWRIEDFHKLWKSGAGVERCRMQSAANLQRMAAILALVALRALQLRDLFESSPDAPCDNVLTETEWHVLWATIEETRPPKRVPSVTWAYRAIGRLAGWGDTKRTGRVGPKTLMKGWLELEAHVAGFKAYKILVGEAKK